MDFNPFIAKCIPPINKVNVFNPLKRNLGKWIDYNFVPNQFPEEFVGIFSGRLRRLDILLDKNINSFFIIDDLLSLPDCSESVSWYDLHLRVFRHCSNLKSETK
jgi:hypothetical protein